jgi:signal transduction histidine kinase/anti-sigma regulatory factor (Ser/Thr protein kinase)
LVFRPRARLLQLLGDQLIGSARLAVFELVKNAYDADASRVVVRLDLSDDEPSITVSDDGEGMTLKTLRDIWLVPGDDHRAKQRELHSRTPRHHRLPLGEKGLGRFAAHKLSNTIRVVTRATGAQECVVDIQWDELTSKPFLDEAPVELKVRRPVQFIDDATGTRIELTNLRQNEWTRGEVRRLQRQVTSICSPFEEPDGFKVILEVPGREEWLDGLPDAQKILKRAIWTFSFKLVEGDFSWKYTFRTISGLKLDGRTLSKEGDRLRVPPPADDSRPQKKVVADRAMMRGIGPISGEFYIYDRDSEVLKHLPEVQLLKEYLDENGGIRVYRDGIRVYNYGEPGDDWLGLDLRRVNNPTRGISRNIILGAVHLSLEHSEELIEKTNREGFVENEACERLARIVLGALSAFESERHPDKERIRQVTAPASDPSVAKIEKPISALRAALLAKNLGDTFEPYVARIEKDYLDMQETLLSAGMSGLNLAVVFHEVERGVRVLHEVIVDGTDPQAAAKQARDLMHLLDGFATLLRRDDQAQHSARKLLEAARTFNRLRLRHHGIRLICPALESSSGGFDAKFSFSLIIGALNNLIDNAIYWMRVRWPNEPKKDTPSPRVLYINTTDELGAPAIVVADTGTGFQGESQENLVRPFFTRKPNGMGLGLYYSQLAMELNGGRLVFPEVGAVTLPDGVDGAVVALMFGTEE